MSFTDNQRTNAYSALYGLFQAGILHVIKELRASESEDSKRTPHLDAVIGAVESLGQELERLRTALKLEEAPTEVVEAMRKHHPEGDLADADGLVKPAVFRDYALTVSLQQASEPPQLDLGALLRQVGAQVISIDGPPQAEES